MKKQEIEANLLAIFNRAEVKKDIREATNWIYGLLNKPQSGSIKTGVELLADRIIPTLSVPLLIKLGSIIIHYAEFNSPGGHPLDKTTAETLLYDPEVHSWLTMMQKEGLLPVKRNG